MEYEKTLKRALHRNNNQPKMGDVAEKATLQLSAISTENSWKSDLLRQFRQNGFA